MKKAVILYNSQTGTTKKYAKEINRELALYGIEVDLYSISDQNLNQISFSNVDYVFLGSWTKGLLVIFQRPDAVWKKFVAEMPKIMDSKVALFTTYKIRTGSMFRKMKESLLGVSPSPTLELESRDGLLEAGDKILLGEFVGADCN